MRKNIAPIIISIVSTFLFFISKIYCQNLEFPILEKSNKLLSFGDKTYVDNFSILDSTCEQTDRWVEEQEAYFNNYSKNSKRIYNYPELKNTSTFINFNYTLLGKYFFRVMYNSDGQSIYKSNKPSSVEATPIVNNKDISSGKGNYAVFRKMNVSRNSDYLAYKYSINGSDTLFLGVFDLKKNKILNDKIERVGWDEILWYKNGFFYSKLDSNNVFYHKLNTAPENDSLVVPAIIDKEISTDVLLINDERYLLLLKKNLKTKLSSVFFIDLNSSNKNFMPLIIKNQGVITFIDCKDSLIYFSLNSGQNKNKLFFVNPQNIKEWHLLIDPKNELLEEVRIFDNKIIASFKKGPISNLKIYSKEGELLEIIEMPLGYTITKIQGRDNLKSFYFNLSSFFCPDVTYEYFWKSKKYITVEDVSVTYDFSKMELIYEEIEIEDNKKIPILIAKQKDTKLSNAPTLLESYGGYGIKFENYFEPGIVQFLEYGGVYVRAYIRGGGELGEEWHKEGSGINKSNTYLDFIRSAKYLIYKNYTSPNKLAIRGASHGGLVVGVAITKNPELFKAAICKAAPLDIVTLIEERNSLFQFNEYGNINDKNELDSILKYNPYFNLKENINYPSLFVYASELDERVPWSNSAKFVALLQNRKCQKNPVLFFLERDAGHYGAEKTFSLVIKREATENLFLFKELDMKK